MFQKIQFSLFVAYYVGQLKLLMSLTGQNLTKALITNQFKQFYMS
ncbi:hypothetical protein NSP_27670 [Nodularia spumigena CCY9414]|nr:hypothetical protein NSP_27670 [Nodularia spumigena CCY9414]